MSGGARVGRGGPPKKAGHARYKSELASGQLVEDKNGIAIGLGASSKGSSGVSGVSRVSHVSNVSQGSGASVGLGSVTIQQPVTVTNGPRRRKAADQRAQANSTMYPDLVAGPLSTHGQAANRRMNISQNDNYVDSSPLPASRKTNPAGVVTDASESLGGASQGRFKANGAGAALNYPSLGHEANNVPAIDTNM